MRCNPTLAETAPTHLKRMLINLLLQICGLPAFGAILLVSVLATTAAALIAFKTRQESLLVAFLPLCFLPLFVAIGCSLIGLLSSIGIQLNADANEIREPGFLLTMNLIPVFFGATASAIPATVTMLGRWMIAWQSSGVVLFPKHEESGGSGEDGFDPEAWANRANQEAEDYLEQLVRPK